MKMKGKFNRTNTHDVQMWHHPDDPILTATKEEKMVGFNEAVKTGEAAEKEVVRFLNDGFDCKHEVKSERMYPNPHKKWMTTGNMYIEFGSRGKASGLSVTKSDFWIHTFYDKQNNLVFFGGFKTSTLKKVLNDLNREGRISLNSPGGDKNAQGIGTSKGAIMEVTLLLTRYFEEVRNGG